MKFQSKLTICMTAIVTIMYGLGGALLIMLSFNNSLNTEEDNALTNYRFICSSLKMANSISVQTDISDVAGILRELNRDFNLDKVRLYDEGEVYYKSDNKFPYDNELLNRCSEDKCALKTKKHEGKYYMQITGCFFVGEKKLFLDAIRDISSTYEIRKMQLNYYHMLFVAVVVLSVVMSFVTAHFLTKSMRYLSKISRRIAGGDYEERARINSGDEMEILSDDFNTMAECLTGKINELEDAMVRQERFVGSFAHEMKTPMTSMIGYADLLRSHDMSREEQRECSEYIFKEAKRLESLSLKLLDLLVLKKHDFVLKEVSPADILREMAIIVNEKLKQANVMLRFSTKKGKCFLEPDLVKSLLINLIDNSIKAIDGDGEIVVKQSIISGGCRYEIIDNGRGIPEEDMNNIKEAFYRVDKSRSRKQGGAGLGLSLCDEIVRLHNGTMNFYSELGKGTRVVIELRGKECYEKDS